MLYIYVYIYIYVKSFLMSVIKPYKNFVESSFEKNCITPSSLFPLSVEQALNLT